MVILFVCTAHLTLTEMWRKSLCTCLWENVCFAAASLLMVGQGMPVSIFQSSQRRINAKKSVSNKSWKSKKRKIHKGLCIKSCTFVSNYLHRSPKPNQSNRIEGQNWHMKYGFPPTSPCSSVLYNNIFFHRQRTCLIGPFITVKVCLRSASHPPPPTAIAVCPSPLSQAVRGSAGIKEGEWPARARPQMWDTVLKQASVLPSAI